MRKITLLMAFWMIFVLAKAAYPQTLPIDYSSFFASSSMGTSPNLEKGTYTTSTDAIMPNQWNRSGKLTSGEGGGVSPIVENSSLNYSTYIDNNVGKAIILDPDIQPNPTVASSTFRTSIYSLTSSSADYTGAFYVGMLVNFTTVVSSGIDFLAMDANHTGNSQRGRVFVKSSANTGFYNMGVGFSGTSDVTGWSGDLTLGTTYFIVLKYTTAATGGTETASLFINPNPGETEEVTSSLNNTVSATAALKSIKGFIIRQRPNMGGKLAGIRFSNNWTDVVKSATAAAPKLVTPTIGIASAITSSGFTANWTPVANASSYDVKVYQGTTLVSTTNAPAQTASSLIIGGLLSGTNYTFKVVAKGNGVDFSDSDLSEASMVFSTLGVNSIDKIVTDFGDGSWGPVATTSYPSGSYPSSTVNGFNLVKTYLYTGTLTCVTGETHTNRILLGKSSESAVLEFPSLTTVGEVQIHAATGTDAMSFRLEELVGTQWQVIDTYTTRKTPDSIYVIPVLKNSVTKLRIANNTGSGLYVYKIVTLTYQEATELTLRSSSPVEGDVIYSNLKKTLTFTFNKNVSSGSGTISLNGVSIPLNTCIFTNNVVAIPVTLTTNPGSNKNYTFTVSAGTFAETGNPTNLSKAISINFQTLKSVAYPSNYTGILDIVYKNVNSENTRMDVYYPTNPAAPVPVIINMHGGGWNHGYKEDQGGFTPYFNMGFAVANVEYRMTGETQAPAAVEDVRGAMIYLLNHAQELNIDPMKIVFQGGSAGGHLALIAGYLRNNPLFDNDCTPYTGNYKVMAVIDKYGPADLTNFIFYTSLVNWLGTRATDQAFIDSLSPINYVNANTPPTYIIHGDADPTVPYSQSVTLQAALQNAGVKNKFTTVPGGLHGGFSDAYNDQMESEIHQFLNEVLINIETGILPQKKNNVNITISGNIISINSKELTKTKVYNSLGKELTMTESKTFELPGKGFYILKINDNNGESIKKILIK
ncbi:MAG: alpha/beta hydrolase fold domain-containing protein [Bacteroidales bacterium]|nr:alpha/beta hydrolase fold domain-containing protein [Bacteroidales bacterium]